MANDFRDNEQRNQFEMDVEGKTAFITYMKKDGIISLNHTEVPKEMQGKGIANELVQTTLNHIRNEGLKVVPNCSFVGAYISRHPEWKSIVS